MSVSLPHAVAVWRRNATMYRRTWKFNILPNFFEPVLYLIAIGIGVGAYISEMGGMSYSQFLAPGLVCVAAMNGASFEVTYNIFVRLTYEKAYDAMLTTPVAPDDIARRRDPLGDDPRLHLRRLLLRRPHRSSAWRRCRTLCGALLAIPLSGLLFAAIGIAFTLRIPTIDLFSFYFTLFLTPLFLFSDVFFPLQERLVGNLAMGRRAAAAAPPGAHRPRTPSAASCRPSCCGTSPTFSACRRCYSPGPARRRAAA